MKILIQFYLRLLGERDISFHSIVIEIRGRADVIIINTCEKVSNFIYDYRGFVQILCNAKIVPRTHHFTTRILCGNNLVFDFIVMRTI